MRVSAPFLFTSFIGVAAIGLLLWRDPFGGDNSEFRPRAQRRAAATAKHATEPQTECERQLQARIDIRLFEVLNRYGETGDDALLEKMGEHGDALDGALKSVEYGACSQEYNTSREVLITRQLAARLLSKAANADVKDGRFARARRRLERALVIAGEQHASMIEGLERALSNAYVEQARQEQDAERRQALAEAAIEVLAASPAAHQLRSYACEAQNDLPCALEAAETLQQLQPNVAGLDDRIEKLRRQVKVEGEFDDARSSHFVARFEGLAAERAGYAAINILERAYVRIGDRLDRRPGQPVTVVIYTGAQYKEATLAPDWTGGIFDGKIRLREGDLLREGDRLESVLFHEYTHALLRATVRGQLPIWVHEGLAQAMEPGFDVGYDRRVIDKLGKVLDLATLNGSFMGMKDRDAVSLAYAQSAVMMDALLSRQGSHGLRRLFDELDEDAAFDAAFGAVYYKTPVAFWQELFQR